MGFTLTWGVPPPGTFSGYNFMTPEVLGYVKLKHGSGWAELSRGTGFYHQPIFGVTVRPDPDFTISKVFETEAAAKAYIASLA